MLSNSLRILLGHIIIRLVYYPWHIVEKVLRRSLGADRKAHYYIMMVFRSLFKSFPVTIQYQNKLLNEPSYIKLRIDLCQNNQQWYFRLKGNYEMEWMKMIAIGMQKAETFVDIGSNVGVYAITIAQVFPDKKVIAVEPLEDNFASLSDNIKLNSLSNVKAMNAAISNCGNNKIKFYPNPIHDGGGAIIKGTVYRTGDVLINAEQYQRRNPVFKPEIEVDNIRIDHIVKSESVIKMDVEGAEISVLESGKNTFEQGLVDMMIIEVLDETIDKVISLLDVFGFDCYMQDMMKPIKIGERLDWFVGNIICLRRESSVAGKIKGS